MFAIDLETSFFSVRQMYAIDRGNSHEGRYVKTNDQTRFAYKEYGMKPFCPSDKQILKNYYEVPTDVLENEEKLVLWARDAVQVVRSQK